MLTKKQHELLQFIYHNVSENGISPSFDEMKEALDLKSKSGIHRLILGLEERGFIRRLPYRARAVEVVRSPESYGVNVANINTKAKRKTEKTFSPKAFNKKINDLCGANDTLKANCIPFVGKIAAGNPIEAIEDSSEWITTPTLLANDPDHFALTVEGDSMIDEGIQDGDIVIIKKTTNVNNGDIVVALIDQSDVTLKRLRKCKNSIALEPANKKYEIQIYGANRIQIQGKLVSLMRQY